MAGFWGRGEEGGESQLLTGRREGEMIVTSASHLLPQLVNYSRERVQALCQYGETGPPRAAILPLMVYTVPGVKVRDARCVSLRGRGKEPRPDSAR